MFWALVGVVHLLAVLCMDTPVDAYGLGLTWLFLSEYLMSLCQPIDPEAGRSFARSNLHVIGFVGGLVLALANVPTHATNRYAIFMVLCIFDYFLCIGHTWDVQTRIGTVANCRLCYACAAPLCLAALYNLWEKNLLYEKT